MKSFAGYPVACHGEAPPDPDIMERPPRPPGESVFSKEVISFIAIMVVLGLPSFVFIFLYSLPDIELARTRMFFMFIIIEFMIALNFRSLRFSVFQAPPHKWLLLALFWEVVIISVLMQVPQVRESFGVRMPALGDLAVITGVGAVVFVAMEGFKAMLRRRGATGPI